MIKICAISDLHGFLPDDIVECDLVLICGDSVSLKHQHGWHKAIRWYKNTFKIWANNLPCEKVLFIAGNHDPLEGHEEEIRNTFPRIEKVTYLQDEEYIYTKNGESLKIYGTPWCKVFGNWHFMKSDEELYNIFKKIPNDLDILMTHDAPYGVTDICLEHWDNSNSLGNIPLLTAIGNVQPTYALHGHLHSSNHKFELLGNTKVCNVSILDEKYQPYYISLYLELNGKNL